MSDDAMKTGRDKFTFWVQWVIGNAAGWTLGTAAAVGIGILMTGRIAPDVPPQPENDYRGLIGVATAFLLTFPSSALLVSLAQWLVLRGRIAAGCGWLVVTFIGTAAGLVAAASVAQLIASWIVFGAIVGILQWLALRSAFQSAGTWIVVNILAGAIGGVTGWVFIEYLNMRPVIGTLDVSASAILIPPIVGSLISGLGLIFILQQGPNSPAATMIAETNIEPNQAEGKRDQAVDWLEDLTKGDHI